VKVLLVEDDATVVDLLKEALADDVIDWTIAATGVDAAEMLRTGQYDLIVCDLRLPETAGSEARDEVGISVLEEIAERYPGTSTMVLSAYADISNIGRFQRAGIDELLTGTKGFRISDAFRKKDFDPPIARIKEFAQLHAQLHRVELAQGVAGLSLTHHQEQVIKTFVLRQAGTKALLEPVVGGMSSTSKVRVVVLNDDGMILSRSVGRIDVLSRTKDEKERYERCITALPAGSFAHLVAEVDGGAGADAGLFYKLADEYEKSLLDLVLADPSGAARSVARLERFEEAWTQGATTARVTVADVRRRSIPDDRFLPLAGKLVGTDWEDLESKEVLVPRIRQHGDMHVLNVLTRADGEPHLIDYSEAGLALGPIDPVTLELSLVFHKDAGPRMRGWPSPAAAGNWWDVRAFADGSPYEPFLVACRQWAHRLATGDRAVAASGYAYSVRQLQYVDVDARTVAAIVRSITKVAHSW
jgi:CheY-like chemotaxis protein